MKKLLPVALLLICFSCLTEDSADPGEASTFIRYYNGGFDDQAQTFKETPDKGFIILATTQITDNNATIQQSKIKLIKTDQFGNTQWQTLYPTFNNPSNSSYYKGRDLLIEKNDSGEVIGYTIVGDSIDIHTGASYMYILKTDADGVYLQNQCRALVEDNNSVSLKNIQGHAIAQDIEGDYLIIGARTDGAIEDMVLAKLNEEDLSLGWIQDYGEGGSVKITGLISDSNNEIYWGGTVKKNDTPSAIRFTKTAPNNVGTAFDLPYGSPDYNEETGGICLTYGAQVIVAGTTDEKGNKDIIFKKISLNGGTQLFTKTIEDNNAIPEEGNAVCGTKDGGALIFGTSGLDEDKDYYLIKLDLNNEIEWSKIFGSKKADTGVGVMQAHDGSYVILGSTTLGGLNSILLMKTNSKGNIE